MIPSTIDDVTPEWLADAIRRPVARMLKEPIAVGVGLVGQLFRIRFEGDGSPSTVIVKLAAPTEEGRFVATVLNMYGREVGFYKELSSRTSIAHPACYFAAHDPGTQDTVLVLEDVSTRGRAGDQVAGCSLDEARSAIRTLARLHACFWEDETLSSASFVLRLADDPYPATVAMAYELAWPRVQELFGDMIDGRVREFGDTYAARIPALFAKLCDGPLVLSHADWRLDNLFFGGDEVIAVDWQLIERSVAPRDLAYHVTQSINIDDAAGYAQAFDTYLADLRDLGIEVDRPWAWSAYRYGAVLGFVYPVVATGALTIGGPRHVELTRALFRRSLAALESLDAFDLAF
ncbi:MAG TPA: phosphotransferase [Acidimicrobiia bacterium]|nr:phosphotransferase [Acidimicrobiia bacterium]